MLARLRPLTPRAALARRYVLGKRRTLVGTRSSLSSPAAALTPTALQEQYAAFSGIDTIRQTTKKNCKITYVPWNWCAERGPDSCRVERTRIARRSAELSPNGPEHLRPYAAAPVVVPFVPGPAGPMPAGPVGPVAAVENAVVGAVKRPASAISVRVRRARCTRAAGADGRCGLGRMRAWQAIVSGVASAELGATEIGMVRRLVFKAPRASRCGWCVAASVDFSGGPLLGGDLHMGPVGTTARIEAAAATVITRERASARGRADSAGLSGLRLCLSRKCATK